jgi:hypothetical protein
MGHQFCLLIKKNSKLKMCINYHAINKITINNNYLLPCIDNLLDQLDGAKYFSRIHLKSKLPNLHRRQGC